MRKRSIALTVVAVVVVGLAIAVSTMLRPGRSGAQSPPLHIAPPDWSNGGGRIASTAGPAGAATGPVVTVPALAATASALHTPTGTPSPTSPAAPSTRSSVTGTPSSTGTPTTTPVGTSSAATSSTPTGTPTGTPTSTPTTHRSSTTTPTSTPSTSTPAPSTTPSTWHPTTRTYPSHVDHINPAPALQPARIRQAVAGAVQAAANKGVTQSVVVLDRRTGATIVSIDPDRAVPAVSIAKLLFAADELDQAGGGAHLDQHDADDLFDMIRRSNDALASDYYGYHGEGALVQRVAQRYHLTGTSPAPNPRYWGGITVTARDIASLLHQVLSDPADGPYLAAPMKAASAIADDGYNQEFGMNAVSGAGSKQGWGCCLGGVVAIHSAGFTSREIVVVLSTAYPDASGINVPDVSAFADDPGFLTSVASVTATAKAAVDPGG